MNIRSIGIVGAKGAFSELIKHWCPTDIKINQADKGQNMQATLCSDVVFLSVPFSAYRDVLTLISQQSRFDQIVVDICSVKLASQELMNQILPNHQNKLSCHPLFGPQSALDELSGHQLVVTEKQAAAVPFVEYLKDKYGLKIISMTADEHDRQMADVHALTFFVARVLDNYGIAEQSLKTPSYNALLQLARLDAKHSQDLYETIEYFNPYAKATRQKFVDRALQENSQLNSVQTE